jgi:hypothetical protein
MVRLTHCDAVLHARPLAAMLRDRDDTPLKSGSTWVEDGSVKWSGLMIVGEPVATCCGVGLPPDPPPEPVDVKCAVAVAFALTLLSVHGFAVPEHAPLQPLKA